MSVQGVRRFRAGAILVGGAVATAVMLGSGVAHAAPGTDVADIASATNGSSLGWLWADAANLLGEPSASGAADATGATSSADLLNTAVTDFTDAQTVLAGIDVSDAPSDLQSQLSLSIGDQTGMLNTAVQLLNDSVGPVESTVLTDFGPLSAVIDQWYFDPLNQSWANDAQALLTADQGLDTAIASGSESDITTALQQVLGADANIVPTEFESIPLMVVSDLFGGGTGDAAAASGLFDLPLGL